MSNNPLPFLPPGSASNRSNPGRERNADAERRTAENDAVQVDVAITSASANAIASNLESVTAVLDNVSEVPVDHAQLKLRNEPMDVDMDAGALGSAANAAGAPSAPQPSEAAARFASTYRAEQVPLTDSHMELMNELASDRPVGPPNGIASTSAAAAPSSSSSWAVPPVPTTWPEYVEARANNRALPGVLPPLATYPPSSLTGVVYDLRMMLHAPLGWKPSENDADDDDEDSELDAATGEARRRETHPEEPRRIQKIFEQLKRRGVIKDAEDGGRTRMLPCVEATKEEVCTVHEEAVWQLAEATRGEIARGPDGAGWLITSQTCLTRSSNETTTPTNTTRSTSTIIQRSQPACPAVASPTPVELCVKARSETQLPLSVHLVITPSQIRAWGSACTTMSQWQPELCNRSSA